MSWQVVYFESTRGEKYVKKFIDAQEMSVKARIAAMISFMEKYGPFLAGKYTKKLRRHLYELRITGKKQIRVLYTVQKKDIILLHAFQKKTPKTPSKEIKTASLRLDRISHL